MNQFIIYGAGQKGRWCLDFLEWRKMSDRIFAFCDRRSAELGDINDKRVISYEEALDLKLPFLISCADSQTANEIFEMISGDGRDCYLFDDFHKVLKEEQTVFLREWCAYHHAKYNDQWFNDAENQSVVDVFWNKDSVFYQYFQKLDLQNVIELACGWGRHVPYYVDKAGKVTLVDILEENMSICKDRFSEYSNITYYKNNGYNLEKLSENSYTSLFTYDSMVHFEMMDVYEYLKDIYRVLKKGSKALFHHSNYAEDYMADFAHSSHARCFMSKEIFAYLAVRAGFKVLDQKVIDWYEMKNLDCITLLEK